MAEVEDNITVIPLELSYEDTTWTSNGEAYDELTETELISKPFKNTKLAVSLALLLR